MKIFSFGAIAAVAFIPTIASALDSKPIDMSSYPTLQAAIDANPGRMIHIPEGEYTIDSALKITKDGTGLYGPARIIQTNPKEHIISLEKVSGARIENLSLTRKDAKMEENPHGLHVDHCKNIEISKVNISENHTHSSIRVDDSSDVTVEDCTIRNYKGLTIDDRTANKELMGYAFKAIDGTGIQFINTDGGVIRNNRVEESTLLPTKENRDKYDLGTLTVVPAVRGRLLDEDIFKSHYTNNWHQGAGIQVSGPMVSKRIIITGNYIFHPAQGMDIHADNVIVTSNLISHAMIGLKAMHGAKHVLIDGNQFSHVDLWGVLMYPGAGTHAAADAGTTTPEVQENLDGGHIISNNIFSDFGFGDQYWNWVGRKSSYPELNVITILFGQLEENPSIKDILVTGNVVYDSGRDMKKVDGKWQKQAPRYHYGLYVEQTRQPAPVNVRAFGNLLSPGMDGSTNYGD